MHQRISVLSVLLWTLGVYLSFHVCLAEDRINDPEGLNTSEKSQYLMTHFGLSYDSFFAGPGVQSPSSIPVGFSGNPSDSGLNFFNYISLKYKMGDRYAVDVQFRNQVMVTNGMELRHQGQRIGISGLLLKGDCWSLKGAINTDVPIGFWMGQIASERTLIFNPGLFAALSWEPNGSPWSLYVFMTPRIWFYRELLATSTQDRLAGGTMNKPLYDFHVNPSANYHFNKKLAYRFGLTVEFLKNVGWTELRRSYMPIDTGLVWQVNPALAIYVYLMSSTPLDDGIRRYQLGRDEAPGWLSTSSLNVWLFGTVF